jgi:hypothetical protein
MARHARTLLLVAAVAVAWALSHAALPGLDAAWLSLLPALALVAFLLDGRYVGEARLDAARRRRPVPQPRARTVRSIPPARRRAASRRRHGGLLLARRLAGRAPPLAA